jgi:hypothetical protein
MERTQMPQQPEQGLRIEFDPASPRIRGRVVTVQGVRAFDGWIQLSALIEELRGVPTQTYASRQPQERT